MKRVATLTHRGLDFADAAEVFEGRHTVELDNRLDYGENRFVTAGYLCGRFVVLVWTQRDDARRVISMSCRHEREERNGAAAWVDPDDAPELTEAHFDRAEVYDGEVLVRRGRGRPPAVDRKQLVSLRLDQDLIEKFRATGSGWQTRINEALRLAKVG